MQCSSTSRSKVKQGERGSINIVDFIVDIFPSFVLLLYIYTNEYHCCTTTVVVDPTTTRATTDRCCCIYYYILLLLLYDVPLFWRFTASWRRFLVRLNILGILYFCIFQHTHTSDVLLCRMSGCTGEAPILSSSSSPLIVDWATKSVSLVCFFTLAFVISFCQFICCFDDWKTRKTLRLIQKFWNVCSTVFSSKRTTCPNSPTARSRPSKRQQLDNKPQERLTLQREGGAKFRWWCWQEGCCLSP